MIVSPLLRVVKNNVHNTRASLASMAILFVVLWSFPFSSLKAQFNGEPRRAVIKHRDRIINGSLFSRVAVLQEVRTYEVNNAPRYSASREYVPPMDYNPPMERSVYNFESPHGGVSLEETFRSFQDRYRAVYGTNVTWLTNVSGASPGAYPTNGFYSADLAKKEGLIIREGDLSIPVPKISPKTDSV